MSASKQNPLLLFTFSIALVSVIASCANKPKQKKIIKTVKIERLQPIYNVKITSKNFYASYKGPDFVNGNDIAHQLSNFVADTLGKYLKAEYRKGQFKKIDFDKTIIKTLKNHPDSVFYTINMPFKNVSSCEAYTCIDHRGSWVNNKRKTDNDLKEFVLSIQTSPNHKEEIKLFKTNSGLYEYWVQFRSTDLQKKCK